jgi:hypothetical protein
MDVDNKETVIDSIVAIEWEMFQRVNEGGPRAECQENKSVFFAMRRGQFNAWSNKALQSYLLDLECAAIEGRNLVAEKYIHMMKDTDPSVYEKLAVSITFPNKRAFTLANEISDRLMKQSTSLERQFPVVIVMERPLRPNGDSLCVTSVESYQKGELMTYSENTLHELLNHIDALERNGIMYVRLILETYGKYCGYETLEDAEKSLRRQTSLKMDSYAKQ